MNVEFGTIEYGCSLGRRKTRHQGVAQPPLHHHLITPLYSTPNPSLYHLQVCFFQTSHKQLSHTTTTSSLHSGSCSEKIQILLLQLTNIFDLQPPSHQTSTLHSTQLLVNCPIFAIDHWVSALIVFLCPDNKEIKYSATKF